MAVLTSAVAIPEETGGNTVIELLRTVFGTSESDSGSDKDGEDSPSTILPQDLSVPAVDGLTLHKRFLTESEQVSGYIAPVAL